MPEVIGQSLVANDERLRMRGAPAGHVADGDLPGGHEEGYGRILASTERVAVRQVFRETLVVEVERLCLPGSPTREVADSGPVVVCSGSPSLHRGDIGARAEQVAVVDVLGEFFVIDDQRLPLRNIPTGEVADSGAGYVLRRLSRSDCLVCGQAQADSFGADTADQQDAQRSKERHALVCTGGFTQE